MELTKQINEGFEALDAKLSEKVAKLEKYVDDGFRDLSQNQTGYKAAGGNLEGKGGSLEGNSYESAVAEGVKNGLESLRSKRQPIIIETPGEMLIKAAATAGTVTTASVPRSNFGGAGLPSGSWPFGLFHAMTPIGTGSDLNSDVNYLRYSPSGANGSADETGEGQTKPQFDLKWNSINVSPFYVAGWSKVSNQALESMPNLAQALRNAGVVQIHKKLDSIIWNGQTTGNNKYEGLSKLATAFTSTKYVNLPDAIEEAREQFLTNGIDADTVVLSYKTYLAIKTLQSSISTYLAGDYLTGDFSQTIRGLKVVISPSITDGKALIMDSSQHQLGIARDVATEVGYVNDDFVKNLATIRTEAKYLIQSYRDDAAYLVTPKAAA